MTRPRRLQYNATRSYGFPYVWIDVGLLEAGEFPYIAGFTDKDRAIEYGRSKGWEVTHETEEG